MADPLLIGGSVIVAAAATQAGWLAFEGIRRSAEARRQLRLRSDVLAWNVEAARKRQAATDALSAWTGWRKFEVVRRVLEGEDICSFYLAPHDRKRVPAFRPGQFLTFQLPNAGTGKPIVRCYSLSGVMRDGTYRISVKRVPAPPGTQVPAGAGSGYFHEHVRPGDILDVRAPSGNFCLDAVQRSPVVLVAGGIGVTPILTMLQGLAAEGAPSETHVFYGVRHGRQHAFRDEMLRLAQEHPSITLHVCYSDPGPEDVLGRDYHHQGHADLALIRRTLQSSNYEFYICGPPPMMAALVPGLTAWGVPAAHIHHEAFGPASVKSVPPPAHAAAPPPTEAATRAAEAAAAIEVVFERTGRKAMWTGIHASLLDFAAAEGIALDAGCRAGNCGTCAVAVKTGTVSYSTTPGVTIEDGTCLTCCSVPTARLVLNA